LWRVPGVSFISLQKGEGEVDAMNPPPDQPLIHLGGELADFSDTAGIVAQLDLVITICTATAHLAGAMGKPCWVLTPAMHTFWLWFLDRTDSPWYPGVVRLFRQTRPLDWSETIEQVALALEDWSAKRL
jgi:ADP-heptose:LPS heptosyltransferase